MLRSDIIQGIINIRQAIIDSRIEEIALHIAGLKNSEPERLDLLTRDALRSFYSYSHIAHNFGKAELKIVELLDLEELDNPEEWHEFVSNPLRHAERVAQKIRLANHKSEQLLKIIEPEDHLHNKQPEHDQALDLATLTVIAIEEEGRPSTPDRLAHILINIEQVYRALATIQGISPSTLSVIGCDSGSDKSFDFLGLASVVNGIKDIIIVVWDRIAFNRQRKTAGWLDLVSHSLPVLMQIKEMQDQGSISPEQAEILRRQIVEGIAGLIDAGVVVKEMPLRENKDLRRLLAPEPKLLREPSLPREYPQESSPKK